MPEPLRQAKALPSEDRLLNGDPVEFNPDLWLTKEGLKEDPAVHAICERFPQRLLARTDLMDVATDVAAAPADKEPARCLVVATYMWGYGRQGRSYLNAPRGLDHPQLDTAILLANKAILGGDIKRGYEGFQKPFHPPGYNWAFFTKYLYFLGLTQDWQEESPRPLIWDSRVVSALSAYEEVFEWEPKWPRGVSSRYLYLCASMSAWARELDDARSDQVELFLYNSRYTDATNESLNVAAAAIRLRKGSGSEQELQDALKTLPGDLTRELDRRVAGQ